jgi:hypothetical protein
MVTHLVADDGFSEPFDEPRHLFRVLPLV